MMIANAQWHEGRRPRRRRLGGGASALVAVALMVTSAAGAAATVRAVPAARTASAQGRWGKAQPLPGFTALSKGEAGVRALSCGTPGNCAAGGYYNDNSAGTREQAWVTSEVGGRWQKAEEVPGTAALNQGGSAEAWTVSCTRGGYCVAGGWYTARGSKQQAFLVSSVNGKWGKAEEVPGTAGLNQGGGANVLAVSCSSAGNCSAGGSYSDAAGNGLAFVVSERGGKWGKAQELPASAAINAGGATGIWSISCSSPGNCGVGGDYDNAGGCTSSFVASQVNGSWRQAEETPGMARLNGGCESLIEQVSCPAAGACAAGGTYLTGRGVYEGFVVNEVNGTWHQAAAVPGTVALNEGGTAEVYSVSCASAGNCSAGGEYQDRDFNDQAFVASEVNGTWRKAEEVPGTAALNQGGGAEVSTVSCAAPGDCGAGGFTTSHKNGIAFVVDQSGGRWGAAQQLSGIQALDKGGGAQVQAMSCAAPEHCSAAGYYYPPGGSPLQPWGVFVISEMPA